MLQQIFHTPVTLIKNVPFVLGRRLIDQTALQTSKFPIPNLCPSSTTKLKLNCDCVTGAFSVSDSAKVTCMPNLNVIFFGYKYVHTSSLFSKGLTDWHNSDVFNSKNVYWNQRRGLAKGKDKVKKASKGKKKVEIDEQDISKVLDHDLLLHKMQEALEELQHKYATQLQLRTSAGVFNELTIDTEDGKFPLIQIAQIIQKSPSVVSINMSVMPQYLPAVQKAIEKSGMNLNPQQDGTTLFVPLPKVSQAHREDLAKSAKTLFNTTKVKLSKIQNKFSDQVDSRKNNKGVSDDLMLDVKSYILNIYHEEVKKAETLMKDKQKELLGK